VRAGTEDLVIDIGVGAKVTGSVTDSNGKPFSQGWVQVAMLKDGQTTSMSHFPIAQDGTFTIEGLEPGKPVALSVMRNDGNATGESITVEPPTTNVRLTLPAATPIKGRLVGSLGSARWRFWAWLESNPNTQVQSRSQEPDGRFTIEGVAGPGPWMVAARSGDDDRYAIAGPVAGGTENVTLELRQGRSIEGRLLAADGGAPPANHQIMASMPGWNTTARVDAQGNFKLRGLPPGRYTLQTWSNDGQMATQSDVEDGTTGVRLTLGTQR
jgi:outer membrane usher protein FimD/PapC